MRGVLAALVALGTVSGCGGGGDGDVWVDGYAFRKAVEITPPALAKGLTDFPVAIFTKRDDDISVGAQPDGSDLLVTDAEGAALAFELEEYDAGDGHFALWVRIPELATPNLVYLYYGGDTVVHDSTETWSSRFAAVWHLTDPDARVARDSTHNLLDLGQNVTNAQPGSARGIVGGARVFDGNDDVLFDDDPGTTALNPGVGSFSYSVWALPTAVITTSDGVLYKGGASVGDAGYEMELGTGVWTVELADETTGMAVAEMAGFDNRLLDRWFHGCAVIDRDDQLLLAYGNGAPRDVVGITGLGSVDRPAQFQVGMIDSADPFAGKIDEVRVYTQALPLEWVIAEYTNINVPETFFAFGPEERRP
jgi:hypothetical protein